MSDPIRLSHLMSTTSQAKAGDMERLYALAAGRRLVLDPTDDGDFDVFMMTAPLRSPMAVRHVVKPLTKGPSDG